MGVDWSDRWFTAFAGVLVIIIALIVFITARQAWDENHYSGPKIGVVIKKIYDDPDTWNTCHSIGVPNQPGYNSCGYQTTDHDGPHWWLLLAGDGKHDEFLVSESEFESVRVGDRFDTENREKVLT
jgi:hypothetical protein